MFYIRVGSSRVSGKGWWWWWREMGNAGASLGIGESLHVCSKGGQPHWPLHLPAAQGPAPELTVAGSLPCLPPQPLHLQLCHVLLPLPTSLFLTPSDTLYPLPLQLSTPLSWPHNDGLSSQISGDWAFFPARPASRYAWHKYGAWGCIACTQAPILPCGSISGAHSRRASAWSRDE